MRHIRVMTDYHCHPLWHDSGDQVGNIDPADLNLSPALIQKLRDWANWYDRTLNKEDPANSGFRSKMAEDAFKKTGRELSDQLIRELGAGFAVRYQEMPRREIK